MKKRTAAMFLAIWMLFGLIGCGGGTDEVEESDPLLLRRRNRSSIPNRSLNRNPWDRLV